MSIQRAAKLSRDSRPDDLSLSMAHSPSPTEHVLVALASAELDHRASDALSALAHRGISLTVVVCATPDIVVEASLRASLDEVGVRDLRVLGSVGARMTDLAPRAYQATTSRTDAGADDSLVAADLGEVAADIATVIAVSGAKSVILWDAPEPESEPDAEPVLEVSLQPSLEAADVGDPRARDIAATARAARRAARVMSVPMFTRDGPWAAFDGEDAALNHPSSVIVGPHRYSRDDPAPQPRQFPWRDQGVGARIGVGIVAIVIGVATGALGTVTQAWTLPVGSIDVPIGLIGALVVTTALLTGLRLLFDTRVVVLSASLGVLGAIAALSAESAGGSVLVPATATSYGWVYGPVLIALLVIAWPRLDRLETDLPPVDRDGPGQ